MDLKSRLILEDYRKQRDDFVKLGDVAHSILAVIAKELGLTVLAVEHRVKEEKSLAGKLERKGDLYNTLEDITANLGVLLADDNAFSSNAEMKIARLDAWDYLNQVYKIACKCL